MDKEQVGQAIVFLYDMFEAGGADLNDWIEELRLKWPEISDAIAQEHKRQCAER